MRRLRPLAVFFGIILMLSLLGLWGARSQSGGLRRLTTTTDEGININPSLSGDGRRIAFESTEDVAHAGGSDRFRAIRADVSTEPPVFVQMGGARAPAPGVSQDGSRIAFAAKEDPLGTNPDGNSEIFYFDGSSLRQVTNTTPGDMSTRSRDGNFQPSLSDDGRFIAFSSNRNLAGQNADGNLEIFVLDTTNNSFSQLTNTVGPVGASDAKISGDGSHVAFIVDNNATPSTQRDLILRERTTFIGRLITSDADLALTYGRAISDDGTRVVFSARGHLFLFDGRTSNSVRQITVNSATATDVPLHGTISGDGTRIAFATRRQIPLLSANSDNSIEVYTYDIPTGSFARVTNAPSNADCLDGSSRVCEVVSSLNDDGSTLAFNFPRSLSGAVTSGLENNCEIYVTGTAARPTVGTLSIVNGASHGNEPATTEAIAPDSYSAAFGGALALTTEQPKKQPNGTFPTNVAGTTVTVNGRAAQIFFVSPTLVYFLAPPQTELGTANVVITNSQGFRSEGTIQVLRAAPGIFTFNGDGTGEGIIINAQTEQPGPFDPSSGNLRLLIFATGVRNATTVTATAAGRALTVESAIASADMPGFDEVRVLVPADLRGTGTVNLVIRADGRDSNPVTVTFTGTARNDIVINEVLADPPLGAAGDANHDGVRDSTEDEFVEIVNNAGDIDISGYQLLTRSTSASSDTIRFTFPAGTFVPAGSAVVVFGGGAPNPSDPIFGGAQIFKITSTTGLALANTGGIVTLRDASQGIVNIFSYGGSTGLNGDADQSLTRSPDITGGFVLHSQAPNAGGRIFSPGTRVDGSPFASGAGRLTTLSISPPSANVTVGQSTQFTAQARDQFNRVMTSPTITFASDNTTIATVDSIVKDAGTGIATATVTGRTEGSAHITATATDGGTLVNSTQSTINVFPPPPVANRVEVTPSTATINRGNTQQFSATAFQPNNQPVPNAIFTWTSSNTNIATVDQNGLATGVGIGTVTITATTSDGAGGTISGTAMLTIQVPVVINEINADVAADNVSTTVIEGDSNRDGVRDSDDDEFVELFNNSSASVDLSGVVITDATNAATSRFTLPANTILASGRALVVFGGGSPPANDPAFGGALVLAVTGSGTLSLNDTGDTVTVKLSVGGSDVVIASQTYAGAGNPAAPSDQSLTRSPDVEVGSTGGGFVAHSSVANAAGRTFSPGTRLDGTPFGSPAITRIEVTPTSANVNTGATQVFTARAFSNVGGPEIEVTNVSFIWDSSDTTKATVAPTTGRTTTATGVAAGNPTIRARAGGQSGSALLTVNPPPPTLSINDVSANEGNGGPTTFTFTVSLSSPAPASGVTFDIATADVTAQDGTPGGEDNDYVARSLTGQTIGAGLTSYTFDVTVNGDVNIEPSETFVVNVTNVSGATLGDTQGQGTIQNDDSASLSINDVSLTEGDSGTKTFTFTVSLTIPAPAGGVTFNIATADGTATTGNNDYVARSLTAQTIPVNQQTYTFDVTVNGDTAVEANETFFVNVTNVSGATVNDGQGQGTIQNDDTANLVITQIYGGGNNSGATFQNDFVEIFNRGATTVDFALTPYSVQYASASGTFSAGNTIGLTSGSLLPGQYFLIKLAGGTTNGVALPAVDGTDTGINMSATDGKVALVVGTTVLSGSGCPIGSTVSDFVGYGSANCSETSATPALSATKSAKRTNSCTDTNNNSADFTVVTNPSAPRNTSSPLQNCTFPDLTINDVSVTEGNAGPVTASFTVTLSAPAPAGGVTFNIATQDNTATVADNDYVAKTLTSQSIAAGLTTYTFDVTVNGDTNIEAGETFFVNVTNVTNANVADSQGVGTIQNDDSPPDLTINDVTANETNAGTTTFTFTVSLSSPARAGGVTFDIATADGTAQDDTPASEDNDYVARSLTSQSIAEGNQTYTFDVTVNGDTVFEGNETFFVNVTNVTGSVTVSDSQGTGTITNDDAQPAISIADTSLTEGNAGTSLMTFTVTLSNASQSSITVNYDTADSSATIANNDYASASNTLTFDPGDLSKTFTVTINGDTNAEGDENFFVNLSAPSGATISDTQALGTIFLDDPFSIAALNTAYTENFDVLAQTTSSTTPAAWTRAESGTAANTTYSAGTGSSTTGDTYSFGVAGVNAITDRALGGLRTGSLVPTIGAFYRNDTGTTINTLQIDYTGEEWRLGTASRTDQLDFQYSTNATSLTTGTWTDVNALDFITPNTSTTGAKDGNSATNRTAISNQITGLSIAPGATFWIRWNDVDASGADDGLAVDDFSLTAGITAPSLSINDVSQAETNAGTTTFNFTVSLSSPAPVGGVSFTVNTADGTTNPATAGSDYVAIVNGSGSIAQSGISTTVSVTVNGDMTVEPDETFFVNISGVTGATLGDGQGLGTVQNDDTPSLSINDVTVTEGNSGPTTAQFTVTLSPASNQTVTVNYATANGTAIAPTDYTAIPTTPLTFNPTETTKTINVLVNGDTTNEAICETFFVNLTTPTNATISDSQGQGSITDDDGTKLVISQIYGGGGNSSATYTNDFIEIFNRGNASVSLNGMSVQYVAATTTTGSWSKTDLPNVTLQPGQYFLIQESSGGATGIPLPTADATGSITMAAGAGRVALVNSTTALSATACPSGATIIDLVGYGSTAICREGATTADNAPGPANNTTSTLRKLTGCQDTNNNATDFAIGSVAPRNTATTLSPCNCSSTSYSSMFILGVDSWRDALAYYSDESRVPVPIGKAIARSKSYDFAQYVQPARTILSTAKISTTMCKAQAP